MQHRTLCSIHWRALQTNHNCGYFACIRTRVHVHLCVHGYTKVWVHLYSQIRSSKLKKGDWWRWVQCQNQGMTSVRDDTYQNQKTIKPDDLKSDQQSEATGEANIHPHPACLGRPHNRTRVEMCRGNHQKKCQIIKASRHSIGFKEISTKMVEMREFWHLKGCSHLRNFT